MTIELVSSSEREGVERTWRALEERTGSDSVASSWAWTGTWLEHYGDLVPHQFAVGSVDGVVAATALLTSSGGGSRPRRLHLGTVGGPDGDDVYVEYNRPLLGAGSAGPFASALVRELASRGQVDQLMLDGLPERDAAPFLQPGAPGIAFETRREPSPLHRFDTSVPGAVVDSLRPGVQQRIRRSITGLGQVEGEWATSVDAGLEIFCELVGLHEERWRKAGQPGAFATTRIQAFHRALITELLPDRRTFLFRTSAQGQTVGCLYGFIERNRALFYQGGLAHFPDNRVKPGLVSHVLAMQECSDRGLTEYDFLAGDARYKHELANAEATLIWARVKFPTTRGRVLEAGRALAGIGTR